MDNFYTYYHEYSNDLTVDFSLSCNFTSSQYQNLIIVRNNTLEVYKILKEKKKLIRLMQSYKLYGKVYDIKCLKLGNNELDTLAVALDQAKLSLLEYSAKADKIITSSYHYYEDLKELLAYNMFLPSDIILRIDPLNRCIVMYCFNSIVLVFPIRTTPLRKQDLLDSISNNPNDNNQSSNFFKKKKEN